MRTGACSVQQALTPEAASVLKLSVSLAKRRGHAQVTPLHVAATLLNSTTSPSFPNLLRRACLKSHPHPHPASRPLQCRALELCFNVSLNRLPTIPPPSSGPLTTHHHPSLSNALIAALKRAQAHQRRGSIELQHQLQQQQQPLLAIKVELEQLIVSILDDPSVSRVMREAGFSSTCVKNNLEEDSSASASSSPTFFFESHREIINQGIFWQNHFLKPSSEKTPIVQSSQEEDLKLVLEVMLKKKGKRSNAVVVGDSVPITEGLVAELMNRVEIGEVPDELKNSQFIKLHLSSLHLGLKSRGDVDAKVSDLRTRIRSTALERGGCAAVIIHAGDLRWAVDEEIKDTEVSGGCGNGFRPVEHLISEVGMLLSELRNLSGDDGGALGTKVWLMATASYQTYMRCQVRHPSLDTQWALQAVVVPSGGLALSLQSPSGMDSRVTKLTQYSFQLLERNALNPKEEQEKLVCCAECTFNYEKEASTFKSSCLLSSSQSLSSAEYEDKSNGSPHLPSWLQPHRPDSHHNDTLVELKRKWSRLCQRLHHSQSNQIHLYPTLFNQSVVRNYSYSSQNPWWPPSSLHNQNKIFSFSEPSPKTNGGNPRMRNGFGNWQVRDASKQWLSEVSSHSLEKPTDQEVQTTLALGRSLFSDSATSRAQREGLITGRRDLCEQLEKNIPWQSESIPPIVEALLDCRSNTRGTWLLVQGTDHVAKRRLAQVAAESICGCMDRLIHLSTRKSEGKSSVEILIEALTDCPRRVIFIEFIDQADENFTRMLANSLKSGYLDDPNGRKVGLGQAIFILSPMGPSCVEDDEKVVKLRLFAEEMLPNLKRKPEWDLLAIESKKPRVEESDLDLNVCAEDNDVPSDLTQETAIGGNNLPADLLELIGACFTLDSGPERCRQMVEGFSSKLHRSFKEVHSDGEDPIKLIIDRTVMEWMVAAGSFLDSLFEAWLREVFQTSLVTVKKSGNVRLRVEGKGGNSKEFGFHGSCLPNTIYVD